MNFNMMTRIIYLTLCTGLPQQYNTAIEIPQELFDAHFSIYGKFNLDLLPIHEPP